MWKEFEERLFPIAMGLGLTSFIAIIFGGMLRIIPAEAAGAMFFGGLGLGVILFFVQIIHDIIWPRS